MYNLNQYQRLKYKLSIQIIFDNHIAKIFADNYYTGRRRAETKALNTFRDVRTSWQRVALIHTSPAGEDIFCFAAGFANVYFPNCVVILPHQSVLSTFGNK